MITAENSAEGFMKFILSEGAFGETEGLAEHQEIVKSLYKIGYNYGLQVLKGELPKEPPGEFYKTALGALEIYIKEHLGDDPHWTAGLMGILTHTIVIGYITCFSQNKEQP